MKPPIVIDENGDICIFETKEVAEQYIEPIDVINHEYTVFDADGNCLILEVTPGLQPGLIKIFNKYVEKVVIREREGTSVTDYNPKHRLIEYLKKVLPNRALDREISISELILIIIEHQGYCR